MRIYPSLKLFGRGKIFDVWSIPHFFFGVVAASFAIVFGFDFLPTFGAILLAAITWELFEAWVGIHETLTNRVTDCALPLFGLTLTYRLFENVPIAHGHQDAVLAAAIFVFLLVNYISWEARFNGEREFQS